MARSGKLYVFEGPDGVGKTTLAELFTLNQYQLGNDDVKAKYFAFPGKIPGTIGEHIYDLHHNYQEYGVGHIHDDTLQFLHIVAHVDAIRHTLVPLLEEGNTIVLDRWWLSTLVYGLHTKVDIVFLSEIIKLEKKMWDEYLVPDAVFLIDRKLPIDRIVDEEDWLAIREWYKTVVEHSGLYGSFSEVTEFISNEKKPSDALNTINGYLAEK